MIPLYNIIVKVDKVAEDTIKTESGLELYLDASFKPEDNARVYGEVVAIPAKHARPHTKDDFHFNVKVGDRLYFNYLVTMDEANKFPSGDNLWMVDYHQAIAVVRDGELWPVGPYILIAPIEEEVYKTNLIVVPNNKKEGNKGEVVASNDPTIPVGEIVEYEDIGKFWNMIEGRKLYCMNNSNILYIHGKEN